MREGPFSIIVIGASLGGTHALEVLFQQIPRELKIPIVIVLHRHKDSDDTLLTQLKSKCPLPITEVEDKDPLEPEHIYIAPADYHILIERGSFALSIDPPVLMARPSIDLLFETSAEIYGSEVLGIIFVSTGILFPIFTGKQFPKMD